MIELKSIRWTWPNQWNYGPATPTSVQCTGGNYFRDF